MNETKRTPAFLSVEVPWSRDQKPRPGVWGAAWLCRVSWMDEHTDVDDGRRASVSLALSAAGHARRISRRVGVWVVGKRKKRSVVGCLKKTEKRFYLPWCLVCCGH